jgi:hypothetical protein
MDWKEFLKPDWTKVVVFVILIFITSSIPDLFIEGTDMRISYGFPFSFFIFGGRLELSPGQSIPFYFHYEAIIENIIIWYLLSCFIVWVFDKAKKRIR